MGFPGMVAMSKILPLASAPAFGQSDLAGPWRVYLQRVESKLASSTTQIGQLTFTSAGVFSGGTLRDAALATTTLTTGSLLVGANGSVTGSLNAGALSSTTADRYTFTGTLRAGKDLITGVVTASLNGRTTSHHGLVTLVREVTLFDVAQAAYSVVEGSPATVTVLRTGNREGTVTVNYASTAVTAAPGDFTAVSGTLTFGPGVASRPLTIATTANTTVDGPRTVSLALSAPAIVSAPTGVSALLGSTSTATVTITDNDVAGTVRLGLPAYTVSEALSNATITVLRSGGAASAVVVQLQTTDGTALAGVDYTPPPASVTFNAGETTKTVPIPILPNTIVDGTRTFTVSITGVSPPSAVVGTPASATVTITDNDVAGTLQFALVGYTASEPAAGAGEAIISVSRTGGAASGVMVDFATADGTATAGQDYATTSGALTFGAGEMSRTFTIPLLTDALVEGDETVLLSLGNPQGGAALGPRTTATLTIRDAQRGLQFGASGYSVNESQATATITVVRTGPATGTATVRYSTSDGTGVGGTNYVPTSGVLTFGNNVTSQTFTVRVLPDRTVTTPRSVLLVLSNPQPFPETQLAPRSTAVLTINNTDAGGTIKLGAATYTVSEGVPAATITVSRTGGAAGGVTVDYTTADDCPTAPCPGKAQAGVDYELTAGTITFGPGETTKTVLVPLTDDPAVEGTETFLFQLSNPQGGAALGAPAQATVTITDNDAGGVIQLSATAYTVAEPGAVASPIAITLTRAGTNLAGGASVQFATSDGTAAAGLDYTATVTTVVFGAGETTKTVPVPILPDALAEGNETVNITLANPGGGATLGARTAAVLTIVDSTSVVQFGAAEYRVVEGGTATITVTRGGSLATLARVAYTSQDDTGIAGVDYRTTSGTLTFNPNVASLTFSVPTLRRPADSDNHTVVLALALIPTSGPIVLGPRQQATLLIQDLDRPGTVQFGAPSYSVTEGGLSPVMVTRTEGSGGSLVVGWSVVGGTASLTQDFTPMSGTLTFGAGVTSQRVPLTIVNDTLAEEAETIQLQLSIVSPPGAQLGGQSTTTLAVLDNDSGGTIRFASAAVTVAENVAGGRVNLTVNRTGTALAGGVLVDYALTGDTGAVNLADGTLTFAAGQTVQTLAVPLVTNAVPEADRTVVVTLSNPRSSGTATGANAPVLGTVPATTITIVDDEPRVQFSDATYSVTEGGLATITVVRTGSLTGAVTVNFSTADGTATAPDNYAAASGLLTVPSGASRQTFTVTTVSDPVATGPRTVNLALTPGAGASIGARSTATLTIQDAHSAGTVQFASPVASAVEGGVVRVFVTRTGANLTGGVTVGWSATGGTATPTDDFGPLSGTLTFEAGVTMQSFDLSVVGGDGQAEGTETIVLSLDPPTGGATLGAPSAMTVLIVDAEQSVAFASAAFTVGETTGQAAISVVRLGVPDGSVTVSATTVTGPAIPEVAEADPALDYVATSTVLSFGPGEIIKTLSVPIRTANALTRSGNRALGLALADPSANAALGPPSTASLTILDFRADLVVASVSAPSSTLTGKLVSAPTTVRNLGAVAAPAFRVGLFLSQADPSPGAGALLALRDVPSLAAGASISLPTQITVDEETPPGDYFVSAVVDFTALVAEGDETNNGRGSAPSFLRVARNLTKFQSASATLSQTSPPPPPGGLQGGGSLFAASSHGCDAEGAINLGGSFTITSQVQQSATGIADLTGTLNNAPVRYVITFDSTADDNDVVTATLTSITVSGAFSAIGTGTLTGTLNGRTLTGTVSGTIDTSTGGHCVFTGSLTAVGSTSFLFRFGTEIRPGFFEFDTTPTVSYPVAAQDYAAVFTALFDADFPLPSTVRFTGPAGSGLSSTPANDEESGAAGSVAQYISPPRTGSIPGGLWSVAYRGTTRTFSVPPLDMASRLVVLHPTVTVSGGNLTGVTWDYRDRLTGSVIAPPAFIRTVQVVLEMTDDHQEFESPVFDRLATSYDLSASPKPYAEIRSIVMRYTDLAGNLYFVHYRKTFNIEVRAQTSNHYTDDTTFQNGGSRSRSLSVLVDVLSGAVDPTPCFQQSGPDYFVSVVNDGPDGPFPTETCIDRTGTTRFEDDAFDTDIFSPFVGDLTGSPLPVGTPFRFTVRPLDAQFSPQVAVARLINADTDQFIVIPNPATPALRPPGFSLADARLGQNQTISWTLPSFPIREVFVSPIVNTQGFARFCHAPEPAVTTESTTATFRLPTTCDGQAVETASVCVFVAGVAGERTTACWFWGFAQ